MCNCEKCIENKKNQEKNALKKYNRKCECWCLQWHHLQLISYNPNYSAWKCMDCDCKHFIIKKK